MPLLLVSGGAAVYLYFAPGFQVTADQVLRLVQIVIVSLLYLSAFFTLGLLVSCLTHRTSTSLMVCLFLWIVLVLAVPNMMPMVARSLRPVPAEGKIAIEKSHKEKEIWDWAEKHLRNEIHDEDEYFDTAERIVAKELEGIDRYRLNRIQEQVSLAQNLARVSPSSCYLFAAYDLGKTGLGSYRRFQRYVYLYRDQFNEAKDRIVEHYREKAVGSGDWWGRQPFETSALNMIPRFRPLEITLAQSVRDNLMDIGLLLTFNVLAFLGAYVAFLRYDVR